MDDTNILNQENNDEISFEDALSKLENIVKKLDEGKDGLKESVALYKSAFELTKHCQKLLDNAKLDVKKVTESVGGEILLESVKD